MDKEKMIRLVLAAQYGDQRAFDELFTCYHDKVFQFALREVKNEEIADDIMQETFIEIFRTIGNLKEPAAFTSWMKRIVYHQCTRYYKKKEVKHEISVGEDEEIPSVFDTLEESNAAYVPDAALDAEELKNTIREFMDSLPDVQRSAVMMKYFDEMSVKQIAEIQGVSENTVLSRLNYGRKALKKNVEAYEEKNNIRLHAIPFLPMLRWALSEPPKVLSAETVASAAQNIAAATGVSLSASSTIGTAATAASASAAVGIGAKIAALPLVAKIIAGATAAITVLVTAVAVPVVILSTAPAAPELDPGTVGEGLENFSSAIEEGLTAIPQEVEITDTLSAQERAELNRYLSYFSEQRFQKYPASDEALFDLAYAYNYYNTDNVFLERGSHFDYAYCIEEEDVNNTLTSFFGKTIEPFESEWTIYDNGVYYRPAADGYTAPYMSVARNVYRDTAGKYVVVFDIYEYLDMFDVMPSHYYEFTSEEVKKERRLEFQISGIVELEQQDDGSVVIVDYRETDQIPKKYTAVQETTTTESLKEVYASYEEMLRAGNTENGLPIAYYAYIDLNHDEIPELLVADADGTPDSWSSGEIYTYRDGTICYCGDLSTRYDHFYLVNEKYVLGWHRMGPWFVSADEHIMTAIYHWNDEMTRNDPAIAYDHGEWEYITEEEFEYYCMVPGEEGYEDGFIKTAEPIRLEKNVHID